MPEENEQWAVVEIMGHVQTAGRISRPGDWGGLLRVDVPTDGTYRTEYYGMAAIYAVKLVSEEIARAYAERNTEPALDYSAPIVTRSQYTAMKERAESEFSRLQHVISELQNRLIAVNALPSGEEAGAE
jgi:hypothetical protein